MFPEGRSFALLPSEHRTSAALGNFIINITITIIIIIIIIIIIMYFFSLCIFFCLIEISVIDPAEYKLPSTREICICMLVYKYENEVLKKNYYYYYAGSLNCLNPHQEIHTPSHQFASINKI